MPIVHVLKGKSATVLRVGGVDCILFKSGQKFLQCRNFFAMKVEKLPLFTAGKNWSIRGKLCGWWYGKTTVRSLKLKDILDETAKVRDARLRGDKGAAAHPRGRMLR